MRNKFEIAMLIKPLDEGLNFAELADMYDMIDGIEVIPYEVQGETSAAMGFINCDDAELINYEYTENSSLYGYIKSILDDQDLETESGEYVFPAEKIDLNIYLGYSGLGKEDE